MAKKKQFAVIGLGRFGGTVCKELYNLGHDVLAIDKDKEKISEYLPYSTQAVQIDSVEENALKNIGIGNFDHVVVAIGEDLQASILTTLVLKDMNVSKVWVKAQNSYHHKVLEKIEADRIIHPEYDMGVRVAQNMDSEKVIDHINLSDEYSIVELVATSKIKNKTLVDMNVRTAFGVTILAIKSGEKINVSPLPTDRLSMGDILIVIGEKDDIKRFENEGL